MEYDFSNNLARFEKALAVLEMKRNGKGGWSGFPYYFTLLFLAGLPPELGRAEINYTAGYCLTKR
ncbi:MAG: hypothetical protein K6U80_04725 [Firmicutes bacterium]|nr:hypothetical protein [Bacillota bacterium]